MKTILTIGGDSYVIRDTDLAKILELLKGATQVSQETAQGHDEHPYNDDWGYVARLVLHERPAKIRVELVLDDEVCTAAEWENVQADGKRRGEEMAAKEKSEREKNLPRAA